MGCRRDLYTICLEYKQCTIYNMDMVYKQCTIKPQLKLNSILQTRILKIKKIHTKTADPGGSLPPCSSGLGGDPL